MSSWGGRSASQWACRTALRTCGRSPPVRCPAGPGWRWAGAGGSQLVTQGPGPPRVQGRGWGHAWGHAHPDSPQAAGLDPTLGPPPREWAPPPTVDKGNGLHRPFPLFQKKASFRPGLGSQQHGEEAPCPRQARPLPASPRRGHTLGVREPACRGHLAGLHAPHHRATRSSVTALRPSGLPLPQLPATTGLQTVSTVLPFPEPTAAVTARGLRGPAPGTQPRASVAAPHLWGALAAHFLFGLSGIPPSE